MNSEWRRKLQFILWMPIQLEIIIVIVTVEISFVLSNLLKQGQCQPWDTICFAQADYWHKCTICANTNVLKPPKFAGTQPTSCCLPASILIVTKDSCVTIYYNCASVTLKWVSRRWSRGQLKLDDLQNICWGGWHKTSSLKNESV